MSCTQFSPRAILRTQSTSAGLVTLEDLIEELIGEIVDEFDHEEPSVERLADGSVEVNGQMAVSAGHVTETTVTPGSGHADAIAQVDADIAALDPDDPDWLGKVQAFRAERARLKALPSEPARVTEEVAPYTVGELWGLLDPAQRRAYLLSAGVQVRAVRGDYRLDGDPARLARGWSATAPVNREMVWQKLHEMADHQAAARWPDDELGTEGEPR